MKSTTPERLRKMVRVQTIPGRRRHEELKALRMSDADFRLAEFACAIATGECLLFDETLGQYLEWQKKTKPGLYARWLAL